MSENRSIGQKLKTGCLIKSLLLTLMLAVGTYVVFGTNAILTTEPVKTFYSPSGEYTLEVYSRYISHYWGGWARSPGVVLLKDRTGEVVYRTTVKKASVVSGPEWKKDRVTDGFRLTIPYPVKQVQPE